MAGALLVIVAGLAAIIAALYPVYIGPTLVILGVYRTVENIGTRNCKTFSELQACEKMILHQPSGLLYLSCSTMTARQHWFKYNSTFLTHDEPAPTEYLAIYDPSTSRISRLTLHNFDDSKSVSFHGMDVVASATNPEQLYVYLVNHRQPPPGETLATFGWDPVIEVFTTRVGSDELTHLHTVRDSLIFKPNDVIGSPDGKSFYFTNDSPTKSNGGTLDAWKSLLLHPATIVGYCHVDTGCKVAIDNLPTNNGITRAKNGTVYVASTFGRALHVLEEQPDNTLVITDKISIEYGIDNVQVDEDGMVWVASFPKMIDFSKLWDDHDHKTHAPSAALKFSINTGPNAFYGEKFKVEKVWEDDGKLASGITMVIHDSKRKKLFIHGVMSPRLIDCTM